MITEKWRKKNIEKLRSYMIKYFMSLNEEEAAKNIEKYPEESIKDLAILYSTYFFKEQIRRINETNYNNNRRTNRT